MTGMVARGARGRRAGWLRTTTAMAVLFAAGGAAQAQAQGTGTGGAVVLDPVTVGASAPSASPVEGYVAKRTTSATKTDTPLQDVPQSITVVPESLIKDQAMQSLSDVVRYIPGISPGQGEGNRDQLTIRGQSTTADFFVDGVRDDVQYYRDLYNVDRVEALKGSNAMIFGRGGGGGVINRVIKEADGRTIRNFSATGGSFNTKRATGDVGQAITPDFAVRLNGVVENSDSYRDYVGLERYGINPTLTYTPTDSTKIRLGYEFFRDDRTADRGIPSFRGAPLETRESTFFGNPDLSNARVNAHAVDGLIEHEFNSSITIRDRFRYANYDKFYQNIFAGAVNAAGTQDSLAAYNNSTKRENLFNQTDLIFKANTGSVKHTVVTGLEVGRQKTDSFRNTGYFGRAGSTATSVLVPVSNPLYFGPVTFRQSATDANATSTTTTVSGYVQDQIELTEQWQLIGGVRVERFDIDFDNRRNGQSLDRQDTLVSPRVGVVYKPVQPLSFYASYSVSYLPSSGDQFTSLTSTTVNLEPEKFQNYEIGAKYEILPNLALTAALFQLERTNTSAPDPVNPGLVVQTGKQRTRGFEVGIAGNITERWQIAGGYALQDAEIVNRTSAAAAGATVPLVPRQTFSLWNKYQFTDTWGAGLGVIHQSKTYAAVDNTVTLPSFTRFDAAVYANVTENVKAQLNVQNLFDAKYFSTANSNNNITPGAPRTFLVTLNTSF
ncbi:TonB-dependent receptor [Azospirillum rugosum]|uniref:Catecholate siderophore receptor n=1 Tax=Azospirillum rugosum TaxID=416170 RepID=A0ABS4SLM1_9PROT|nr:TonB-dependent siderophore receptor [Azospirillum rugosum]MBP2293462.1 catecholate siderophore receptor [Azospirillum rugosum]MDQ0530233.1 catecholate siderophore receptor [Azospirillum rugosum]